MRQLQFNIACAVSADMDNDSRFAFEISDAIHRFVCDDWGVLCDEDKEQNSRAKAHGGRIFAAYETARGKVYIITDDVQASPAVTTVLYAHEY